MLTLKQLRQDLQFNRQLSGLVDVLRDIASAQFRQLQAKREYFMRFANALESFFKTVDLANSKHTFITPKPSLSSSSIVMITSNEGFLGELNSQVINAGLAQYKSGDELVILGERGAHFLEELKKTFLYFPGISEEIRYEQAQTLRDYLVQQYLKNRFARVILVYPKFISFVARKITTEQLLPYSPPESRPSTSNFQLNTLIEPSEARLTDYLIRIWLAQKIYDIFWESKLSEWASRVIHLEESSQAVSELDKRLQFSYFRTLHRISDKNIRETFASMIAEKQSTEDLSAISENNDRW